MASYEMKVAAATALARERERCGGRLPDGMLGNWARALDLDRGSLCRWSKTGVPPPKREVRTRFQIVEHDHVYAALLERDTFKAAHDLLVERHGEANVPSLSTLTRAFHAAPEHVQAVVREGRAGWRNSVPVEQWIAPFRNSHWQVDHHQLDIVIEEGNVWMTTVLDCFSRAIMGYSVSLHPNQGHVAAALAAAVRLQEDRGPFCGVCHQMRFDGGPEHLSNHAIEFVLHMQLAALPTMPGTPTHNGRVERVQDTITTTLLSRLPGYTPRRKSRRDRAIVANKHRLSMLVLSPRIAKWVDDYNLCRPHSALGGLTPLQMWLQSGPENNSDLFLPDAATIRRFAVAGKRYKIRRAAVHPGGETYIAKEFGLLNGTTVEVRIDHNDPSTADIYLDGELLCVAWRKNDAPDAVVAAWREAWAEQADQLRRASNIARRNARQDYKAITDATPPQRNSRVVPRPLAAQKRQQKASALAQRVAGRATPTDQQEIS